MKLKNQIFQPNLKIFQYLCVALIAICSVYWFATRLSAQTKESNPIFTWPIFNAKLPTLRGVTSTFAESRSDHFHNGVDIASKGKPIRPVAPGKYLFSRTNADDPFWPVPGPGNLVFLEHKSGWWSGYFHLQKTGAIRNGNITKESIIGYTGNSGHSSGAHLHFFLIRNNGDVYINPMNLLPKIIDNNPPVIGQLVIVAGENRTLVSHSIQENIRLTKRYPIYLTIIDPGLEKSSRRGVYRLTWKLNKEPEQVRTFSSLSYSPRGWLLEKKYRFKDAFFESMYNLGELKFANGSNILTVVAQDFAGNETTRTFNVNVNRQY